ncbi:MAG TPA: hypothetical protein VNR39_07845 [Pseudolabrys sp.]|nr:hypothetical protein [Pseudolabrys sp.]
MDISSNSKELVEALRLESTGYFRQWVVWLGVGSGAGAAAVISLASNLPDTNYAFQLFLPSLWAFVFGVAAAAISVLFASLSAGEAAVHYAEASNRENLKAAVAQIPEMLSAPRRIADEHNEPRNRLIGDANLAHERAESSWKKHTIWRSARIVSAAISAGAFVVGCGWPLVFMTLGGKLTP